MTVTVEKCPTCGAQAVDRSEFWECCVADAVGQQQQLHNIKQAIRKYHLALDKHEHGGVAASNALNAICEELDMHWKRGETTKWLEERPALKRFYE